MALRTMGFCPSGYIIIRVFFNTIVDCEDTHFEKYRGKLLAITFEQDVVAKSFVFETKLGKKSYCDL